MRHLPLRVDTDIFGSCAETRRQIADMPRKRTEHLRAVVALLEVRMRSALVAAALLGAPAPAVAGAA